MPSGGAARPDDPDKQESITIRGSADKAIGWRFGPRRAGLGAGRARSRGGRFKGRPPGPVGCPERRKTANQ